MIRRYPVGMLTRHDEAVTCKHGTRPPSDQHAYPTQKAGSCKHGTLHDQQMGR